MNYIVAARKPLGMDVWKGDAQAGLTLTEIAQSVPGLPDWFWQYGEIRINGEVIEKARWDHVRPKDNPDAPSLITLHLKMMGGASPGGGGGGGGGKSPLGFLGAIAGALLNIPFPGFGFIIGAALSVAFSALDKILFPPPKRKPNQQEALDALADDRTITEAGISGNILGKSEFLPRVLGKRDINPPLIRPATTRLKGKNEFFEAIFALAGPHKLENIKLGGTLVEDVDGVVIETREGWQTDTPLSLVTTQGIEEEPNLRLSLHNLNEATAGQEARILDQTDPAADTPKWHTVTAKDSPDEIRLGLIWTEGLFDDQNPTVAQRQMMRIRIRERGTSAWLNLPEIHFHSKSNGAYRKTILIKWGDAPLTPPVPTINAPIKAFRAPPSQGTEIASIADDPAFPAWIAIDRFGTSGLLSNSNTILYDDRVEFYLDENETPKAIYEIAIRVSEVITSSSLNDSYVYASHHYDFFEYHAANHAVPGIDFRVTEVQANKHGSIILNNIVSEWFEYPIGPNCGCALIAIRGRNKRFDNLTVEASGYVEDWNGTDWSEWKTTSNPAPHFRDVLSGGLNSDALPVDLIDEASLINWREFCASQNLTLDAVVRGRPIFDSLIMIAATGQALPRGSEKWGVIVEKNRTSEAPVQFFTPRNSENFSFTKSLARTRPQGIRAQYISRDKDYKEQEVEVYDDGVSVGTASFLEEVKYDGIVTEVNAIARARLDLRQARLRSQIYTLEADVESLVCQRGDLVGVQHDVLGAQIGFARIKSIELDPLNRVTGITLDAEIPVTNEGEFFASPDVFASPDIFALGRKTGVAVRLDDGFGGFVVKELSNVTGEVSVLTFVEPFLQPIGFDPGALVISGPLGREFKRLIVIDITWRQGLSAQLTLADEAPEIHT